MDAANFQRRGYAGPVRVMAPAEAAAVVALLSSPTPAPLDWAKGMAPTRRLLYDLAIRPVIIDPVREVLGADVVLWGASVVTAPPGHVHGHHVDIETADPAARSVAVWIGLENTGPHSGLRLVAGSHRYGLPVQRAAYEHGRPRRNYTEAEVLDWAGDHDPAVELVIPAVGDGEALWFDGHLWHGSHNTTNLTRRALLLQYASAATPIRILDLSHLDWPFRLLEAPRPPCLVVSGDASDAVNRLVPPPPPEGAAGAVLSEWVATFELPLAGDAVTGFRPHHQFRGATSNLTLLSCHVSRLEAGVSPHPPHTHEEEEILVALTGSPQITYDDAAGRHVRRLAPGDFAYYPTGRAHTLEAVGESPAEYLMFKWSGPRCDGDTLDAAVWSMMTELPADSGGLRATTTLEGHTSYLHRLHGHLSVLGPGAGYDAHYDFHDVAIVLLEGTVVSLGTKIAAPAVLFTSGGHPHGMHNPGPTAARYLVFEFHGNAPDPVAVLAAPPSAAIVASPTVPVGRRIRVTVWNWGGRITDRFPRIKQALRRTLGPLSPWR